MSNFKVICKIPKSDRWAEMPVRTKTITTKKLFGLISNTVVVSDLVIKPGPNFDEICIVYDEYDSKGSHYYKLLGYPYGGYLSRLFIKLDEFTETAEEIAKKSQPALN